MYNSNIPSERELPSTAKLIKSTIIAIVTALVLLVTVVMPSEYGVDPVGFGEMTGLKRMGEIKVSLAEEAAADLEKQNQVTEDFAEPTTVVSKVEPEVATAKNERLTQDHEITFTLAPDEGTEVKVTMTKGSKVAYNWKTDGGKANFDVHGDSKSLKINYHPYYKGSDVMREGILEAAFDGSHGWFWRNRTKEPLTITIKTNGEYSEIKRY
jgi:hypothetical protein